eukprot:jgi/Bigna1/135692/aug1.30_g10400
MSQCHEYANRNGKEELPRRFVKAVLPMARKQFMLSQLQSLLKSKNLRKRKGCINPSVRLHFGYAGSKGIREEMDNKTTTATNTSGDSRMCREENKEEDIMGPTGQRPHYQRLRGRTNHSLPAEYREVAQPMKKKARPSPATSTLTTATSTTSTTVVTNDKPHYPNRSSKPLLLQLLDKELPVKPESKARKAANIIKSSTLTRISDRNSSGNKRPEVVRKRPNFNRAQVKILNNWFLSHLEDPYPTPNEKDLLGKVTGLSFKQVSNWFVNARSRRLKRNRDINNRDKNKVLNL